MRNRNCQVENSLCLAEQKRTQKLKKKKKNWSASCSCPYSAWWLYLSRTARNLHRKTELGVFFQGCTKQPQCAFAVPLRIERALSQFCLSELQGEFCSDVLFSDHLEHVTRRAVSLSCCANASGRSRVLDVRLHEMLWQPHSWDREVFKNENIIAFNCTSWRAFWLKQNSIIFCVLWKAVAKSCSIRK